MSIDFIYEYLPSFYKKFFRDSNGNSLLDPLLNLYEMLYGDCTYQALQIRQMINFNKCPFFIHETNISIDVTQSNVYLNGFKVHDEIVWLDQIWYDAAFTSGPLSATLYYDPTTKTKYVVFADNFQAFQQTCVFCPNCYKDKQIFSRVYGQLLNYQMDILNSNSYTEPYILVLDTILNTYITYRQKLLAIRYGLVLGPTITVLNNAIGMWLLNTFSPITGIVRDVESNNITIQNNVDQSLNKYTVTTTIKSSIAVGNIINQYDIIETPRYLLYDIFSNPARFTQILLAASAANIVSLLNINTGSNEQYANLFWDINTLSWDSEYLYWDMGNGNKIGTAPNGNISILVPDGSQTVYTAPWITPETQFTAWADSRFNNQMIYEMFRNITIVEVASSIDQVDLAAFLNRFKPTYAKFLFITNSTL